MSPGAARPAGGRTSRKTTGGCWPESRRRSQGRSPRPSPRDGTAGAAGGRPRSSSAPSRTPRTSDTDCLNCKHSGGNGAATLRLPSPGPASAGEALDRGCGPCHDDTAVASGGRKPHSLSSAAGATVPVLPGAEPFSADGGEIGVLLCHGFTGCPQSLRPWAEAMAKAGHTVRLPLLPGHGTTWQDMNRTTWRDWYGCVEDAFRELRARCDAVVVGGLSMGGALALRLAEQHGTAVSGLVLVNPAVKAEDPKLKLLPVVRFVIPSLPGIGSDIKRPGVKELAYDRS